MELTRANKVAVNLNEDGVLVATFKRTHKVITEVKSTDTQVEFPEGINKLAIREIFRVFVIKNSEEYGVLWQPENMSTKVLPAKYENEDILGATALSMITPDIENWVNTINEDSPNKIKINGISIDDIRGMTVNMKGKQVEPKYLNGNLAWYDISLVVAISTGEGDSAVEGYVTLQMELVSGQLKKPTSIGDGNYNLTNFKAELIKDMGDILNPPKKEKVEVVQVKENNVEKSKKVDSKVDSKVKEK